PTPLGQVAPLQAHARAVHGDVLVAQAVACERLVEQALALGQLVVHGDTVAALGRLAQATTTALGFLRSDQVHAPRMGLIDPAGLSAAVASPVQRGLDRGGVGRSGLVL